MNTDNYIMSQYVELKSKELLDPEFIDLYAGIENNSLKEILASLHKQYVTLFKSMNDRLPAGAFTAHFWADPSRALIRAIDMTLSLHRSLKKSKDAFEIDEYYLSASGLSHKTNYSILSVNLNCNQLLSR